MIPINKSYHALTGSEIRQAILNEVGRALDNAGFNSVAITYPQVSWSWKLQLDQKGDDGQALSDTPERQVKAESPGGFSGKLITALGGGSKKYQNNPPSPTEVRMHEKLPLPGE